MAGVADAPAWTPEGANSSGPPHRQPPINPRHVATLLWMRWKLTVRGYRRGRAAGILSLLFSLLFIVLIVGAAAFGTNFGYVRLPHPLAVQLLFAVIAGVYVVWIVLPLLQYSLNEGLDITKIQIYPVTRAEQMVSLVLATLMDVGTLGLLGMYVPIVLRWSPTPAAAALTVVALALAYVHTVGISQLVLAAMMGLLRSRRFRDVSIVAFALLGASCSFLGQFIARLFALTNPSAVVNIHLDTYLQYTPPGIAARAIALGAAGEYLPALGWLAALAALVPVLLAVWARVLERGITAAETGGSAPGRRVRRRAPAPTNVASAPAAANGASLAATATTAAASRRGVLAPAALAIAAKDARYLWRDPQLKASLLSSLFVLVFVLFPSFGSARVGATFLQPMRVLYAPLPTLIVALNLSLNSLGLERQALQMLYLFPVRPLDVFWGKNLTVGSITFGAQVVLATGLAALTGGWSYLPLALAAGLASVLVLMACGNVTSVLMPFRVREFRSGRTNLSSENGCLRSILSMVTLAVSAILLLPVVAALVIPLVLDQRLWFIGSLPAAVAYGAALHQIATRLIAPRMLTRAPEILAATIRE